MLSIDVDNRNGEWDTDENSIALWYIYTTSYDEALKSNWFWT